MKHHPHTPHRPAARAAGCAARALSASGPTSSSSSLTIAARTSSGATGTRSTPRRTSTGWPPAVSASTRLGALRCACLPARCCSAANTVSRRASMTTGLWPPSAVICRTRSRRCRETLQQAGYTTFMGGKWHLEGLPGEKAWGFDEYVLYGSLCEAASHNQAWRTRYQGPWWPWPGANRRVLARPEGQCHPYATWQPMIIRNGEFVETGPDDFGPDILSRDVSDFIERKRARRNRSLCITPSTSPTSRTPPCTIPRRRTARPRRAWNPMSATLTLSLDDSSRRSRRRESGRTRF